MRITRESLVADSPPSSAMAASSVSPGTVDSPAAQPAPGKPNHLVTQIRRMVSNTMLSWPTVVGRIADGLSQMGIL